MPRLSFADGPEFDFGWVSICDGEFDASEFDASIPVIGRTRPYLQFRCLADPDPAKPPQMSGGSETEHQVTGSANDVEIALMEWVDLVEPESEALIGPDTVFRWTSAPDPTTYALRMECSVDPKLHGLLYPKINYRWLETTATQRSLPEIPQIDLSETTICTWLVFRVEGGAFGYDTPIRPPASRRSWSAIRQHGASF